MKIILSITLVIVAFVLSIIQNSNQIKVAFDTILAHDKLTHCIGSQILFCAFYAVCPNKKAVSTAVLSIGISIEIAQHYTGRVFDRGFGSGCGGCNAFCCD
jgi:uncharacterized membrane protein YciS (DUF1049 family)